jgi:hypothetical protein
MCTAICPAISPQKKSGRGRIAEQRLGATVKWEMFLVQVIQVQPQAANKVAMTQPMLLVIVSPVYIKNNELTQGVTLMSSAGYPASSLS